MLPESECCADFERRDPPRRPIGGGSTAKERRTPSGLEVKPVYRAEDVKADPVRDIGEPGQPPYTRGIHPGMYRDRLWTMRQFAGFGTAKETNERFHYLLRQGQTGLSTAFDMPTLMGYDSGGRVRLRRGRHGAGHGR